MSTLPTYIEGLEIETQLTFAFVLMSQLRLLCPLGLDVSIPCFLQGRLLRWSYKIKMEKATFSGALYTI